MLSSETSLTGGSSTSGTQALGRTRTLFQLADHELLRDLKALLAQDRETTVALLRHLAEVDQRRLHLPAGYSSMFAFCVHELRMSEDMAFKRIRAARAIHRFSVLLPALADGRVHLTAVVLLAPHLKPRNVDELLLAVTHKTKAEIDLLIASRFPRLDLPTRIRAIQPMLAADPPVTQPVGSNAPTLAPEPVAPSGERISAPSMGPLVLEPVGSVINAEPRTHCASPAPEPVAPSVDSSTPVHVVGTDSHPRLTPLSPGRFAWQLTVDQETQDLLRYAQALLGHSVPSGDIPTVLRSALEALVQKLEAQKFGTCARSRARCGAPIGRNVPAAVRHKIWQRDGGQCAFVSEQGRRCEARTRLEYDHVNPVARGGQTSVENLRLLCRAHNQHAAERVYGEGFMREKREAATRRHDAAAARKAPCPRSDIPTAP